MDAGPEWLRAFPLQTAVAATEAFLQAWQECASQHHRYFNPNTNEPDLTNHLKFHLRDDVGPKRGVVGHWTAEDVIGRLDPSTGKLLEKKRRTDIAFAWNDTRAFELVFEFKRLRKGKRSRDQYLGEQGLARFVTGIYGKGQAIAAMVGVLLAPEADIVPPIQRRRWPNPNRAKALRLRKSADVARPYTEPSTLFPKAVFDTEHYRKSGVSAIPRLHSAWRTSS